MSRPIALPPLPAFAALPALAALLSFASPSFAQVEGYYRFPAVRGETVVFNAEGDLWSVPIAGGAAHRLTTHAGQETNPVLSPDGRWVAFAGAYEGAPEVYVMPASGGLPRRVTWDGSSSTLPVTWTADGRIVYRTTRYSTLPNTRLHVVDPATGAREAIPLAQAAEAAIGPDGTIYFTRLPRQASNARWYKGGLAQSIWRWRPGEGTATPLTADWPGTSKNPLWHDGRIYYLSDRAGLAMNVWSMAPDGSDLRRHTDGMDWDLQEMALDAGTIVFRRGADLWRLDPATGASTRIGISLVSDVDQRRETWEEEPASYLTSIDLSPSGDRVALAARGEVFVAPVGGGRLAHVSRDAGVRHRSAEFAPDGRTLYTLSDASGEVEWWSLPADGVGAARQVTSGTAMLRLGGVVSPDAERIAHVDYDRRLWIVDVATGRSTLVSSPSGQWASQGTSLAWSPDSRYLAFSAVGSVRMSTLYLHDTDSGATTALTTDRYEDFSPAWSADGNWLWFLSNRDFNASGGVWGARAMQPWFERQTRIYALPMREDAKWPFQKPDELAAADTAASGGGAGTGGRAASGGGAGTGGRAAPGGATKGPGDSLSVGALRVVPVGRGEIGGLEANGSRLYWLEDRAGSPGRSLMALDLKHDAEPVAVADGVSSFQLSADGKKLLVVKGRADLYVIASSAGASSKLTDARVDLSGWRFPVDKAAEWTQIFVDAWRMHRDYFYDPGLHGVDWEAVRSKYEPLVARVGAREELADLQAQMVSELSLMHSNAGGGDTRQGDDDVLPGALGAVFERVADGFRVVRIYEADPDIPEALSPLARPESAVAAGSVVLSVNGVPASGAPDIGALLRGEAGRDVRLRVRAPDSAERDVVVLAISAGAEADLRYSEWEYARRLEVERSGNLGYVHLRAMGGGDIGQWTRDFYPAFNRQGLVIDVRHNGGGNIDSWILGQLLRRAWMYWKGRTGEPYWNMQYAFRGHVVVLVDERTGSDGEAFADGFRRLGIGEVIGTRTWGGEVWLSSSNRQVDGGVARASESGVYGPEGEWLIEGWGVVPDVTVDNDPHESFGGRDAQLEAAIAHLKRLIEADPRPVPEPPPYPRVRPGVGYPTVFDR